MSGAERRERLDLGSALCLSQGMQALRETKKVLRVMPACLLQGKARHMGNSMRDL